MRKVLLLLVMFTTFFLLDSCRRQPLNFLHYENQNKIIALQPLDSFDTDLLDFLCKEISSFYHRKVIILKPIAIPQTFIFPKSANMCSADSLINFLYRLVNDTIVEVIGLTHRNIYTTVKPKKAYEAGANLSSVFGLGDVSGNSCVISDYWINSIETARSNQRLRTVVIHEIGHNLGLQHCPNSKCIMSDQNGKLSILDQSGNDYCHWCQRSLKS